jgi:hypothetical protein
VLVANVRQGQPGPFDRALPPSSIARPANCRRRQRARAGRARLLIIKLTRGESSSGCHSTLATTVVTCEVRRVRRAFWRKIGKAGRTGARSSAAAETSKLLGRFDRCVRFDPYNFVKLMKQTGVLRVPFLGLGTLCRLVFSMCCESSLSIRARKPGRLWIGNSRYTIANHFLTSAPRRTQAIPHWAKLHEVPFYLLIVHIRSVPGSYIIHHTSYIIHHAHARS